MNSYNEEYKDEQRRNYTNNSTGYALHNYAIE